MFEFLFYGFVYLVNNLKSHRRNKGKLDFLFLQYAIKSIRLSTDLFKSKLNSNYFFINKIGVADVEVYEQNYNELSDSIHKYQEIEKENPFCKNNTNDKVKK